mmetsp:Transcript_82678/g.252680  ORF Transcript_82678/g.252680 Transcript_82678/m.252680 type:complete len:334 (+) Transcript_82678:3330-4331(+)
MARGVVVHGVDLHGVAQMGEELRVVHHLLDLQWRARRVPLHSQGPQGEADVLHLHELRIIDLRVGVAHAPILETVDHLPQNHDVVRDGHEGLHLRGCQQLDTVERGPQALAWNTLEEKELEGQSEDLVVAIHHQVDTHRRGIPETLHRQANAGLVERSEQSVEDAVGQYPAPAERHCTLDDFGVHGVGPEDLQGVRDPRVQVQLHGMNGELQHLHLALHDAAADVLVAHFSVDHRRVARLRQPPRQPRGTTRCQVLHAGSLQQRRKRLRQVIPPVLAAVDAAHVVALWRLLERRKEVRAAVQAAEHWREHCPEQGDVVDEAEPQELGEGAEQS